MFTATPSVAELSSRLLPLEQKLAWIALVMEGKQTCDGRELAELRDEANRAKSSEMAYQRTLRETLQDQDNLRAEAQLAISSARQSSQTVIDDLGRRNKELENYLNQEWHQLSQERQTSLSCRQEVAHINHAYNEDVTALREQLQHSSEKNAVLERHHEIVSENLRAQEGLNLQAQRLIRQKLMDDQDRIFDLEVEVKMLKLNTPELVLRNEVGTETEPFSEPSHVSKVSVSSSSQTEVPPKNDAGVGTEGDLEVSKTETCRGAVSVSGPFAFNMPRLSFW